MKKLLKVLGAAVGAYLLIDLGVVLGAGATYEMYEYPESKASKSLKDKDAMEVIEWYNGIMYKHSKKKSSKERSEVLRYWAEQWAKKGYSSEEIKQGLDALKKELD